MLIGVACEKILGKIREDQLIHKNGLAGGAFNSLEEYKFAVGFLQGLIKAEEIVNETYLDLTSVDREYIESK